jgi:hypothetical protein
LQENRQFVAPRPAGRDLAALVPHLIVAATAAYLLAFVIKAPVAQLVTRLPDDACYYFKIGENVARGAGSTFDGCHPTNGFHPLWVLMIASVHLIVRSTPEIMIKVYLVLQIALVVTAWGLAASVLRPRFARPAVALAAVFFAYFVFQRAVNGMESALLVCLLAGLLHHCCRCELFSRPTAGSLIVAGVLLGAVLLTRLDLVFFAAGLNLVMLVWLQRGHTLTWTLLRVGLVALVAGIVVAPAIVYNVLLFGHPVPISGQLKSAFRRRPSPRRRCGRSAVSTRYSWPWPCYTSALRRPPAAAITRYRSGTTPTAFSSRRWR